MAGNNSIPLFEIAVVAVSTVSTIFPIAAISTVVAIAATITAIITVAKILPVLVAVVTVIISLGTVIGTVFNKRFIVEFELAMGDIAQFPLYRVVVYQFFMPVAVGKLHVIGDGIGKPLFLFRVFFPKGLVNDYFNIFSQVIELRVFFGVF